MSQDQNNTPFEVGDIYEVVEVPFTLFLKNNGGSFRRKIQLEIGDRFIVTKLPSDDIMEVSFWGQECYTGRRLRLNPDDPIRCKKVE